MSRLCCEESKKGESKDDNSWVITNEEIEKVVNESLCKSEKPTTADLYERIDDLEFEVECLREDVKDYEVQKNSLKMLLQYVSIDRFSEKNKTYVTNIIQKIKQILN